MSLPYLISLNTWVLVAYSVLEVLYDIGDFQLFINLIRSLNLTISLC